MPWNLTGSYFETCSCDVVCPCTASSSELTISRATRSQVNAFGIQYEARAGFSRSEFAWAS